MNKYRILAFDGGGMLGVSSLVSLVQLAQGCGCTASELVEKADLIAGTSAGAMNTLGCALRISPEDLISFYETMGPVIFPSKFPSNYVNYILSCGGIISARYSTESLKKGLYEGLHGIPKLKHEDLQNLTFGNLVSYAGRPKEQHHLITSFKLNDSAPMCPDLKPKSKGDSSTKAEGQWKAKIFHNFPEDNKAGRKNPDLEHSALDVAIRSSSAPGLFPIYQGYVDGVLLANNPSMCAIAQALNPATGNQKIDDIWVLSLGSGRGKAGSLPNCNDSWGFLDWGYHLDMFIDAFVGVADYQARQILADDHYIRVDPCIEKGFDAGDGRIASEVERVVNQWFTDNPDEREKAQTWFED